MTKPIYGQRTKAQQSTTAIQRLYVTMRHLFNRGYYKPMGVSGEALRQSLITLGPEIYGSLGESKVELAGLLYVIDRLPEGIEECRYINLTSNEGYQDSHFKPIIPPKRRRNCYRIDEEQMNIEITRGRSEIYDILTHLTFLYLESQKIMDRVLINEQGDLNRDWQKLEEAVVCPDFLTKAEREIAITHTANILGRTFKEVTAIYGDFGSTKNPNRFLHLIYWLGKLSLNGQLNHEKRTITFSTVLRERLGQHIHGEVWAHTIKKTLDKQGILNRPLHIISANMHSVQNSLFAPRALTTKLKAKSNLDIYEELSQRDKYRAEIVKLAKVGGMTYLEDKSGTNIDVQIFDTAKLKNSDYADLLAKVPLKEKPVIIVMDYAFGEQAYETMDELLKPYKPSAEQATYLNVKSISIMGKAGILKGHKGDVMIPSAHIFEGSADNYPFKNGLSAADFNKTDLGVYEGAMISVLGTSLQNKDLLRYFCKSTWGVVGLEMEGAHYQKAIQAHASIRKSVSSEVVVNYAYYASDNPLKTGSTLASGGLGTTGVKPTYLITEKILEQIFN